MGAAPGDDGKDKDGGQGQGRESKREAGCEGRGQDQEDGKPIAIQLDGLAARCAVLPDPARQLRRG